MRLAFYFALRDTVVADSLDQASRIAYGRDKRWGRVVTIKVCFGSLKALLTCLRESCNMGLFKQLKRLLCQVLVTDSCCLSPPSNRILCSIPIRVTAEAGCAAFFTLKHSNM